MDDPERVMGDWKSYLSSPQRKLWGGRAQILAGWDNDPTDLRCGLGNHIPGHNETRGYRDNLGFRCARDRERRRKAPSGVRAVVARF